jgi:hypothetical protein
LAIALYVIGSRHNSNFTIYVGVSPKNDEDTLRSVRCLALSSRGKKVFDFLGAKLLSGPSENYSPKFKYVVAAYIVIVLQDYA